MNTPTLSATANDGVLCNPDIRIFIETRGGHSYRYHANDLTLVMRKGVVRVIEKEHGCFIFFDRCDIVVTDVDGNTLFHLNHGRIPDAGSDLYITAGETT
jgi:hypothetical protein